MNKTYKYTLPKGMEVEKTNVRVENGQILVDVELKEKFDPKDGDFLICPGGGVFIYNGNCTDLHYGAYCGIDMYNDIAICSNLSKRWTCKQGCRFATSEEKSAFLERLETELSKRWNPETKQLEDIRWKPKEGEKYYFVDTVLSIVRTEFTNMISTDRIRVEANNCFKTKEATQIVAEQLKDIFKNSKAE